MSILEFAKDCYGKDLTNGGGEIPLDAYKREVVQDFPKLAEFYQVFQTKDAAVRNEVLGEVASPKVLKATQTWKW
jgi:hypothetical protein